LAWARKRLSGKDIGTLLPAAIIPLVPGISQRIVEAYREDVSWAVRFLENSLGLHYYPVPTLVVDHYTVKAVRAEDTVDAPSVSLESQQTIADIGELLGEICLCFHVRGPWEAPSDYDADAVARSAGMPVGALELMRRLCEWTARHWFVPSWWHVDSRRGPALKSAATLKDAVLVVVDAALGTGATADAVIQVEHCSPEKDCAPWKSYLEKYGVAISMGAYEARLSGRAADFRSALSSMRRYLTSTLSAYDDRFRPLSKPDEWLLSAATVMAALCEGLLGRDWLQGGNVSLDRIIRDEVSHGRWERARQELSDAQFPGITRSLSFVEFGRAFFMKLCEVLEHRASEAKDPVINIGYAISQDVWLRLEKVRFVEDLQTGPAKYGDGLEISGKLSDVVRVVSEGWQTIENLLRRGASSAISQFFVTDVQTYGIFAPASATGADTHLWQLADDVSLPHALTLPASHRVLLCADALDDFAARLSADGRGLNAARLFVRSVVVHEHFHAFVETAPDINGAPPRGPAFAKHWKEASAVNEALAAWMQLHMARDKPELLQLVQDYIAHGDFPEWPYAGATHVEEIFKSTGLEGVRGLAGLLRSDPPRAAAQLSALALGKAAKSSRGAVPAIGTNSRKSIFDRLFGRGSDQEKSE
jgi:hypothetical protein